MNTYDSEILNVEELCEWLMIGRTTASRLLNGGIIKAFKINLEFGRYREEVSSSSLIKKLAWNNMNRQKC